MNNQTKRCDFCGKEYLRKQVGRVNGKWRCQNCRKEWRKNHREFLKRDILHIRKREDLVKEWKKNREEREKQGQAEPKIRGAKPKKRIYYYNFYYLTQVEKTFLYKKYSLMGLDPEHIKAKIKRDVNYLQDFVRGLREKRIEEEQINDKFKEEFAKLIMQCR